MDLKLKRRLTGAVILVSLAVIFIPVILEGPDNEWTPLNRDIPETPRLDYRAPAGRPQAVDIPPPAPKPAEIPVPRPADPVRVKPPASIPQPLERTGGQAADTSASNNGAIANGWYVQVGSFSQEHNAGTLSKRIQAAGFQVRYQKSITGSGLLYRVLVGPSRSRERAQAMRDRLAAEMKLKGMVVRNMD